MPSDVTGLVVNLKGIIRGFLAETVALCERTCRYRKNWGSAILRLRPTLAHLCLQRTWSPMARLTLRRARPTGLECRVFPAGEKLRYLLAYAARMLITFASIETRILATLSSKPGLWPSRRLRAMTTSWTRLRRCPHLGTIRIHKTTYPMICPLNPPQIISICSSKDIYNNE